MRGVFSWVVVLAIDCAVIYGSRSLDASTFWVNVFPVLAVISLIAWAALAGKVKLF